MTASRLSARMFKRGVVMGVLGIGWALCAAEGATPLPPIDQYNVVWDSQSKNSDGSMPIGNGDIGANVWMEPDGVLSLMLSKTDAWDELGRIIKLGEMRLTLSPNAFHKPQSFHQELDLRHGRIILRAQHAEHGKAEIHVWFDANHPVARIEVESEKPTTLSVLHQTWRTQKREVTGSEMQYGLGGSPRELRWFIDPDVILDGQTDRMVFFHRNLRSIWPDTLRVQSLEEMNVPGNDPLMHLTSGAIVRGPGLKNKDKQELTSEPGTRHLVNIYPYVARTDTSEQWVADLERQIASADKTKLDDARAAHAKWWDDFWQRHWIFVAGEKDAQVVTRGYVLQRWITACGARGNKAIKFNGSIFTMPPLTGDPKLVNNPDFRVHGPCFWWQNTRFPYWPMLMTGDYEMMQPLFKMYSEMLPIRKLATRKHYGHDGAYFPETIYFWGTQNNQNYGWDRTKLAPGMTANKHTRYEWVCGIELSAMMLAYYEHTLDEKFLRETLLPFAGEVARFYAQHYKLDKNGKLDIYPSNSLENLWDARNPAEVISGFMAILPPLMKLTKDDAQRREWATLLEQLPPLPTKQDKDGQVYLAPADSAGLDRRNAENSELYAFYPYRLFSLLNTDVMPKAELAYKERQTGRGDVGWIQHSIFAATLGMTDTAKRQLVSRMKGKHGASRFPAFWGGFDWVPDQCHGGVSSLTLQNMLMQPVGDKILLLPAWPKEWDVDFKIHAPNKTLLEGKVRGGRIETLNVTPESRRANVVIWGDAGQ